MPGEREHLELLQRFLVATWWAGRQDVARELSRRSRVEFALFGDDDPPGGARPVPQDAVEFLRQREALAGKWSRDLDAAVTNVLVNALQNGADVRTTMAALARVFPIFTRARLENIARTEATTAYNAGRLAAFKAEGDFVRAVQFSAILDERTTDICRFRDGLIMRMDDPRLPANTPPLHFMCRSVLLPIDRILWRKLEAGDKRAERNTFGHLPDGPQDLATALDGWRHTPAPLPGFGATEGIARRPDLADGKFDPVKIPSSKTGSVQAEVEAIRRGRLIHISTTVLSEKDAGYQTVAQVQESVDRVLSRYPPSLIRLLREHEVRVAVLPSIEPTRSAGGKLLRGTEGRFSFSPNHRLIEVSVRALRNDCGVLDEELYHAWDLLLGSKGEGGRLSEGVSAYPKLLDSAQNLRRLFDEGESFISDYAAENPREFLAQTARFYATMDDDGRRALQELTPELYNIVKGLFFDSANIEGALQ